MHEIWTVKDATHIASTDEYLIVAGSGEVVWYDPVDASVKGFAALPNKAPAQQVVALPNDPACAIVLSRGFIYNVSMKRHCVVSRCGIMFPSGTESTHIGVSKGGHQLHVSTDDAIFQLSLPELNLANRVPISHPGFSGPMSPPLYSANNDCGHLFSLPDHSVKFVVDGAILQNILQLDSGRVYVVCDMSWRGNKIVCCDDGTQAFPCDVHSSACTDGKRIAFVAPDGTNLCIVEPSRKTTRQKKVEQIIPLPNSFPLSERVHDIALVGQRHVAFRTSDGIVRMCALR